MARVMYQKKVGKKYITTWECEDVELVYEDLSNELIAKKLEACTYIKSIKRKNNYDGTKEITVNYAEDCGGGRRIYTIKG